MLRRKDSQLAFTFSACCKLVRETRRNLLQYSSRDKKDGESGYASYFDHSLGCLIRELQLLMMFLQLSLQHLTQALQQDRPFLFQLLRKSLEILQILRLQPA